MKVSRVREFDNVRNKNLSEVHSQNNLSLRNSTYLTHHFDSRQAKMQKKKPLCSDCVNGKLVLQKKQKAQKQKEEQLTSERQFQKIQQNQAKIQEYRANLMKEASSYNQKAVCQRKKNEEFQKWQDESFMKTACQLESKTIQLQSSLEQQQKQKLNRYRKELEEQLKEQTAIKQTRKSQKFATEPDQCIIVDHDYREQHIRYGQQLKKQINQEKRNKEQIKQLQHQIDQQSLVRYEKDFFKYTEFKQPSTKSKLNPEMFEEMKQLQIERKQKQMEQREIKQKNRKQELMKAKKQAELMAQKSLKTIKSYATVLSVQIEAKKRQEEQLKKKERQQFLQQLEQQELHNKQNHIKPCGECCKKVDQFVLSYY